MSAVAQLIEGEPASVLRREYAERINGYWHKSRANILALGRTLVEARQKLSANEFNAMVEQDLNMGYDNARRFMRIASDPKLTNFATLQKSPDSFAALDELRRLNDEQFEKAISAGDIRPEMTVKEAKQIVRDIIRIAPAPRQMHRAESAKCGPPKPLQGRFARTWPELLWKIIERRKLLNLSQRALDQAIGWGEGQQSHYETPHDPMYGRLPTIVAVMEMVEALGCHLELVPNR